MRARAAIFLFLILMSAGVWRQAAAESAGDVRIEKLVVESETLPARDRLQMSRSLRKRAYPQEVLQAAIQNALRDLGYYKAVVDEPRVSVRGREHGEQMAEVLVRVKEGPRYFLGEIRFQGAHVFTAGELRNVFWIQAGDPFAPGRIYQGLEGMRDRYETLGYVNFVAVPTPSIDEARDVIDLAMDVDEGQQFNFGSLVLDGIEPRPGAGRALLDRWKTLHGRRYDSTLLQGWLRANESNCPACTRVANLMVAGQDAELRLVNFKLVFP